MLEFSTKTWRNYNLFLFQPLAIPWEYCAPRGHLPKRLVRVIPGLTHLSLVLSSGTVCGTVCVLLIAHTTFANIDPFLPCWFYFILLWMCFFSHFITWWMVPNVAYYKYTSIWPYSIVIHLDSRNIGPTGSNILEKRAFKLQTRNRRRIRARKKWLDKFMKLLKWFNGKVKASKFSQSAICYSRLISSYTIFTIFTKTS